MNMEQFLKKMGVFGYRKTQFWMTVGLTFEDLELKFFISCKESRLIHDVSLPFLKTMERIRTQRFKDFAHVR